MEIVLVAAVARNGVIGARGGLPWRLPTDMKRFKALTIGKPVIMGRKTFQSMAKPLVDRVNIVVTRDPGFRPAGVEVARSYEEALQLADARRAPGRVEVCVIGGGEIYARAIGLADRLEITHVLADVEGDVRFPPIDPAEWQLESEEQVAPGPKDTAAMRFATYRRR